jgi:MbtH protein
MAFEDDDAGTYVVLINDEEQYSLWPERKSVPAGWKLTGFKGPKAACVSHVDETWIDMRPKSLREAMDRTE